MQLRLTRHFEERWMERVGNWPTAEAVDRYISDAVPVQHCEDYLRRDGSPYRILAIYWHPQLGLILKVDTIAKTAVTVLTVENWKIEQEIERHEPPRAVVSMSELEQRAARIRRTFTPRVCA